MYFEEVTQIHMHNLKAIFSGCQHDWRQFFNKFLAFCKVHIILEKIYLLKNEAKWLDSGREN